MFKQALSIILCLTLAISSACGLRKKDNETDAQFKARQKAIYVAQSTLGLNGWSDAVEVLGNGGALSPEARRVQYQLNEQITTGLDVVRNRLRNPVTGDALAKLKGVLLDIREAQQREVVKIGNAETRAQLDAIFEISLFALESLQAVIEESKEPTRAEQEEKAAALQRKVKGAIPPYLIPMITLARETGFEALRIYRLNTTDAWAKAEDLSLLLHSKNAARLSGLQ